MMLLSKGSIQQKWIFNSFQKDFLFIGMTSFVGYIALMLNHFPVIAFSVLAFSALIEGAHIYSTSWRIYIDPAERGRNWIFWAYIIFFGVLNTTWIFKEWPFFYEFGILTVFYHNIRQFYGVNKWYQKINGDFDRVFDNCLYVVTVVPFFLFCFRTGRIYLPFNVYNQLQVIYVMFVLIFIVVELYKLIVQKKKIFRLFILLIGIVVYDILLVTDDVKISASQLAFNHSMFYIAIVALSVERLKFSSYHGFNKIFLAILVSSIFFYLMVVVIPMFATNTFSISEGLPLKLYMIIQSTCSLSHYFIDAHIWRTKYPRSKLIYSTPT